MATKSSTRKRAPRRSSDQIRELLLEAGAALFESQGYHATTTQQLVDRAGVDAPTLYRHFESKADLFEATMLGPLQEFLGNHADYWSARPLGEVDPADLMRRYATGLVNMLHAHRDQMRTLIAASREDGDLGRIARRVSEQFTDGLVAMRDILVAEGETHDYPGLNAPDATIAASTGMILSVVLFDDWVFPRGRQPSRAKVIDEVTAMVLYGVTRRPPTAGVG
jgi:AcrR family transcriptional regulator